MEVLIVIGVILTVWIFLALVSHSVDKADYKYYKAIYDTLTPIGWYTTGSPYHQWKNKYYSQTIYFEEVGDIKLLEGIYIHNNFWTYINPYTCYWYFKYSRWFKKNVLPQYTDYTVC